jgi:hypothetical protein
VQDICALYTNNTALESKRRKQNVGTIVLNDLAYFVKSLEQNSVQLGIRNHDRFDKNLGRHDQVMESLLCTQDTFRALSRDVNQIFGSTCGTWRRVAKYARKGWWEVDGCPGSRLNQLDVLASASTNQCVHGQFKLHGIDIAFEL